MVSKETGKIKTFYWTSFQCEICKKLFPFKFKTTTGKKYTLLDYTVPKTQNHLVLESINLEKIESKLVYLITPVQGQSDYKVGRGLD